MKKGQQQSTNSALYMRAYVVYFSGPLHVPQLAGCFKIVQQINNWPWYHKSLKSTVQDKLIEQTDEMEHFLTSTNWDLLVQTNITSQIYSKFDSRLWHQEMCFQVL